MSNFSDVLAAMRDGEKSDPEATSEERVTPEETLDETPGKEEESNSVGEPESEEEPKEEEPVEEPEADDSDEPEPEEDEEPQPKDEDEPEEATVNIDGEEVTLSQLREWRKSGLMLDDYTRKTQDVAAEKRKALEDRESIATLADDIAGDKALQQFLSARPEALGHLMKEPEAVRAMLGNPKAVEEFWSMYDALVENPELAKKFEREPSEAEQALRVAKEKETMENVVSVIEGMVEKIGSEFYPEVNTDDIYQFVANLSGIPADPTHEQQRAGIGKLYGLFFEEKDGEVTFNPALLGSEFERLKATKGGREEETTNEPDPEEHNRQVDQALKDDAPPKTPGGAAPSAGPEKQSFEDFNSVMDALRG